MSHQIQCYKQMWMAKTLMINHAVKDKGEARMRTRAHTHTHARTHTHTHAPCPTLINGAVCIDWVALAFFCCGGGGGRGGGRGGGDILLLMVWNRQSPAQGTQDITYWEFPQMTQPAPGNHLLKKVKGLHHKQTDQVGLSWPQVQGHKFWQNRCGSTDRP